MSFEKEILPIVKQNCTPCHYNDGIAPFNLLSISDFHQNAPMISEVIKRGLMPPWMPDSHYSTFQKQRVLNDNEKSKIINFIKYNKIYNFKDTTWSYKANNFYIKCDTTITLHQQKHFEIDGDNTDKFFTFYLESELNQNYWLRGIKLNSTNTKLVHHAWLFQSKDNFINESNKQIFLNGKASSLDIFGKFEPVYGYLPGFSYSNYENDLSKKININADLFLQIHYYSTPYPQRDSTSITLFLDKKKSKHELKYLIIHEGYLNQKLFIPKNKKRTFTGEYTITENITLYSIIPHMHFRGKSIEVYATNPGSSKHINLIKIENWDFIAQELFVFKNRVHLNKGSKIFFKAKFDNTTKNPKNPINPPIDVKMGDDSKDEMLQVIFEYYN